MPVIQEPLTCGSEKADRYPQWHDLPRLLPSHSSCVRTNWICWLCVVQFPPWPSPLNKDFGAHYHHHHSFIFVVGKNKTIATIAANWGLLAYILYKNKSLGADRKIFNARGLWTEKIHVPNNFISKSTQYCQMPPGLGKSWQSNDWELGTFLWPNTRCVPGGWSG